LAVCGDDAGGNDDEASRAARHQTLHHALVLTFRCALPRSPGAGGLFIRALAIELMTTRAAAPSAPSRAAPSPRALRNTHALRNICAARWRASGAS